MIVPLSLSLRKKNSLSTRTTHREEFEYIGICLGELMRFFIENLEKKISGGKKYLKG
jgi:hypothetical protein